MLVARLLSLVIPCIYCVFCQQENHEATSIIHGLVLQMQRLESKLLQNEKAGKIMVRTIDDLGQRLEKTTKKLNDLKERCSSHSDFSRNFTTRSVVKRVLPLVAFTTYLDHNIGHLGIDHTIKYNKIILNEGNAYNVNTGIFTCPHNGLYEFNFMVSIHGIQQIVAKLVVDGTNIVDGIADSYHTSQEIQGGNTVLLSLKRGQSVWVANYRWADINITSADKNRFSTFSGHLVAFT